MSGDVVKCQQCGGAVHICEQPDSTCRFSVRAREFFTGRNRFIGVDILDLARLLRETEDEAGKLARVREAMRKLRRYEPRTVAVIVPGVLFDERRGVVAELREDPDGRAVLFADVLAALEGA